MRLSCLPVLALLSAAPALGETAHLVKDINPVPAAQGSIPQGWATLGKLALFTADDGETGEELWRTDGTAAGTFQLADTCPGECRGNPALVARTERFVFFRAFGRGFGPVDLWRSDGSVAGSARLAGLLLLPEPGRRQIRIAGQSVLRLYQTDGTSPGTVKLLDLWAPGQQSSFELVHAGPRLLFRKWDRLTGSELWALEPDRQGD